MFLFLEQQSLYMSSPLFVKVKEHFCKQERSFVSSLCFYFWNTNQFIVHHVYLLKQMNIFVDNKEVLLVKKVFFVVKKINLTNF
ncbi:hypothetical protein C5749_15920 [Sphingobacterium gobiense]|uniref:Uncharacterized protein n=1 Tax=Sphingobacterium gobiense TaxID=1382456 RepID=A0A2S9JIA2_9SPHI|nr:hypothetical protein C5749_15920 [Sphingobacterium gobiense]